MNRSCNIGDKCEKCQRFDMILVYDDSIPVSGFLLHDLRNACRENGSTKILVEWCMGFGLIANCYKCPKCGQFMRLSEFKNKADGYVWRCRKSGSNSHEITRSVRNGSWFSMSNLGLLEILFLTNAFVCEIYSKYLQKTFKFSPNTTCEWFNVCREVCFELLKKENKIIGGEGKFVEIDVSKFGKRIYSKGKSAKGKWVFGGIERGSNACVFDIVSDTKKATLIPIIQRMIAPETTIISDLWGSYRSLKSLGYSHISVKEANTSVNTNLTEGSWSTIKSKFPSSTSKNEFSFHIAEYIWRKNNALNKNLLGEFLKGVISIFPPHSEDSEVKKCEKISSRLPLSEDSKQPSTSKI